MGYGTGPGIFFSRAVKKNLCHLFENFSHTKNIPLFVLCAYAQKLSETGTPIFLPLSPTTRFSERCATAIPVEPVGIFFSEGALGESYSR
jgi:hypothetical protein